MSLERKPGWRFTARYTDNKDAVLASCRFFMRAPIRKFRCKILDDAYTYRVIVLVNPWFSILSHSKASKLASESSELLDHRRVLSISIFRKCWIFLVGNLKFLKSLEIDNKRPQRHNAYPRNYKVNMSQFDLAEKMLNILVDHLTFLTVLKKICSNLYIRDPNHTMRIRDITR